MIDIGWSRVLSHADAEAKPMPLAMPHARIVPVEGAWNSNLWFHGCFTEIYRSTWDITRESEPGAPHLHGVGGWHRCRKDNSFGCLGSSGCTCSGKYPKNSKSEDWRKMNGSPETVTGTEWSCSNLLGCCCGCKGGRGLSGSIPTANTMTLTIFSMSYASLNLAFRELCLLFVCSYLESCYTSSHRNTVVLSWVHSISASFLGPNVVDK